MTFNSKTNAADVNGRTQEGGRRVLRRAAAAIAAGSVLGLAAVAVAPAATASTPATVKALVHCPDGYVVAKYPANVYSGTVKRSV